MDGCVKLEPDEVLRATPRSFALRVRDESMIGAGIYKGDVAVGEFTPEPLVGGMVVALVDGESVIRRLVKRGGRLVLVADNLDCPDVHPLSELVVQGVVHTIVHRVVRKARI